MKEIMHGHARKSGATPTYRSWKQMHRRCAGYSAVHKQRYVDRGITVCPEWETFEQFLADMGERPAGTTLDRIDVNKGYSPSNCRWASKSTQAQNKSDNVNITYNGLTLCSAEWSRRLRISRSTIQSRLKKGWPVDRVLSLEMFHSLKGRRDRGDLCKRGHDLKDAYIMPDGRRDCRQCRRIRMHEYVAKNSQKMGDYKREYYLRNRERILSRSKAKA